MGQIIAHDEHGQRGVQIGHVADGVLHQAGHRHREQKQYQTRRHAHDAGVDEHLAHRQLFAGAAHLHDAVGPQKDVEYDDVGGAVEYPLVTEDGLLERDSHIPGVGEHRGAAQHPPASLLGVLKAQPGHQDEHDVIVRKPHSMAGSNSRMQDLMMTQGVAMYSTRLAIPLTAASLSSFTLAHRTPTPMRMNRVSTFCATVRKSCSI